MTVRSDSFGSNPGHFGACSFAGVFGPPVQPTPKSFSVRSAASALAWSAFVIRTVGSSAAADAAQTSASKTPAKRTFAPTTYLL